MMIKETSPLFSTKLPKSEIEKTRAILLLEVDKAIPQNIKINSFTVIMKPISFKSNMEYKNFSSKPKIETHINQKCLNEFIYNKKDSNQWIKLEQIQRKMSISERKLRTSSLYTTQSNSNFLNKNNEKKKVILSSLKYLKNLASMLKMKSSTNTINSMNEIDKSIKNKETMTDRKSIYSIKSSNMIYCFPYDYKPIIKLIKIED